MDSGGDSSQFVQQFKGSAVANLVFACIFIVYKIIDKKFAHSKCESNSKCCKCSSHEDSFSDDIDSKSNDIISGLEKEIDQIKRKLAEGIRTSAKKAIQRSRTERSRSSGILELVEREKAKEQV